MTKLSENDLQVLELVALEVPWFIVCSEFHHKYGSAEALALRLYELRHLELLEIESSELGGDVTLQALVSDAIANGCYEDCDFPSRSGWVIVATAQGFEHVQSRFRRLFR